MTLQHLLDESDITSIKDAAVAIYTTAIATARKYNRFLLLFISSCFDSTEIYQRAARCDVKFGSRLRNDFADKFNERNGSSR